MNRLLLAERSLGLISSLELVFLSSEELDSTESTGFKLKVLQGVLDFLDERGVNAFLDLAVVVCASRAPKRLGRWLAALNCLVDANIAGGLVDVLLVDFECKLLQT